MIQDINDKLPLRFWPTQTKQQEAVPNSLVLENTMAVNTAVNKISRAFVLRILPCPHYFYFLPWFLWGVLLLFLLMLNSCSSADQLLGATGVRQSVYRRKTDVLLTELHYPITNNTNLDGLLREKILGKYRKFRKDLDNNGIEYLNRGIAFTYRATFDTLRSPDLQILSFVLYETIEIQGDDEAGKPLVAVPNSSPGTIRLGAQKSQRGGGGQSSSTKAEIFMYSLRSDGVVDFLDVIEDPLLVLEGLASSCLRQLNEYIGLGNFYSQGIKPDREHLSMLSFGKSGIQVSFPPGQVLSADQGVVNILVPWAEAIPYDPWQFGIVRSFRPLGYRSRKKEAEADKSGGHLKGSRNKQEGAVVE